MKFYKYIKLCLIKVVTHVSPVTPNPNNNYRLQCDHRDDKGIQYMTKPNKLTQLLLIPTQVTFRQ